MKKRIACITMVFNEINFLPLWISYYGKNFGKENLFVIDDGSNDGSTSVDEVNIIKVPKLPFSDVRRAKFISDFQKSLLNYYDVVIYTDADEFLVPDPKNYESLNLYCNESKLNCVTAVGLNIYHIPKLEPDSIDWAKPILGQRKYVKFQSSMCKTLISQVPMIWGTGFHRSLPGPCFDKDLYLFHLKHIDYNRSFIRQSITRDIEWDSVALIHKQGNHQRQSDDWLKIHLNINTRIPEEGFSEFEFSKEIIKSEAGRNIDNKGLETVAINIDGKISVIPDRFYYIF